MSTIKDSGHRRTFNTGAVRDMQEGKGRCDLMPLKQVADILEPMDKLIANCLNNMALAQICLRNKKPEQAKKALRQSLYLFAAYEKVSMAQLMLEVSKHYEQGAKKYGAYNWQKGIPYYSYIDSAVRHLFKHLDGMTDEPHDRAFTWNVLGLLWEIDRQKRGNT